ncbi:MAG TPA: 3'-5' exonuclease, partial [Nitrospira sp.]|nr:3'-5' exonuclease [Nitrospira sp.]
TIDSLRDLTKALCSELVELESLRQQIDAPEMSPWVNQWVRECHERAQALLDDHDRPKRRKIEQMLAAAATLMQLVANGGPAGIQTLPQEERECLAKDPGNIVAGWEKPAFTEAATLIKTANQLLLVNHPFFKDLLKLLEPLILQIRASFAQKGWVSFDGLLAKARALLRDHPAVRERIKREYRAVLVDEFQDTDPIQYEIILAVSERQGNHARDWHEMALEPGKLFIVGDPKQSIYAFRRADIEAFDRVVQKIETDGGMVRTLTTNFRSDAAVLGPVNDVFDRLFERRPLIQPANVRLEVRPQRRPSPLDAGVRLHVTVPGEGEEAVDAARATRDESEGLARWIKDELSTHPNLKAGQIALLFRKLTQADTYLDALRRYDIPYVIEGEKHFYRRQEVIDLVNVLRVLDHPHDSVALAGLLRSPLGGLPDRTIYDLRQADCFNYLHEGQVAAWNHSSAAAVQRLYRQLARLHRAVGALPLGEAIQLIFDRLPLLEIAGASLHGEQAVANLLKIKQTAAGLSDRPHLTLSGFVDLMVSRLDEQPDEAESPLSEESSDAVQILTIHKAKGLEFPVVILPGLHQGSGRERSVPTVTYDWSSGTYGLSLGEHQTFGSVLVQEKLKMREEAERRRVLYVGMTRAKEVLLLSGGVTARSVGETVLGLLQNIGEGEVGTRSTDTLKIGDSLIPHRVIEAPDHKWPRRSLASGSGTSPVDPAAVAARWDERRLRWSRARATATHLTPTTMGENRVPLVPRSSNRSQSREAGRLIGIVIHRILEQWDFAADPAGLSDRLAPAIQSLVTSEDEEVIATVRESVRELLATFGRSDLYAMLRKATILGREVPFVMPWGDGQVLEGVIDIIYRLDGRLWIADYKTDAVSAEDVPGRAERYRTQAMMYKTAAAQSLGVPSVSCRLLFLRAGIGVDI